MLALLSNPFLWTAGFLLIGVGFVNRRSAVETRRRGISPGLFSIKIWPARIYFLFRGREMVYSAYHEAKDETYLLHTMMTDRVILPPKFLPELRILPAGKLNASATLVIAAMGEHNGIDVVLKDRQSNDVARVQLTKSLPSWLPDIVKEVDLALSQFVKECTPPNHVTINARNLVTHVNVAVASLVFGGRQVCHNKDFWNAITSFEFAAVDVSMYLILFPERLRPFVRPYLPATKRLNEIRKTIRSLLLIPARAQPSSEPTVFNHYLATAEAVKASDEDIISKFLILAATAMHQLPNALTQALYDLCMYPQYIEQIRNEALAVLLETNNTWTMDTLKAMKHLDSFLKESQRTNPPAILAFDRVVMSDIKLSDGTLLRPGQFISMPAGPMASDQAYYENPTKFDGDRFYGGDEELDPKATAEHEFAGYEPHNLHWGSGRYTCPGRWYASAVMKVIVASILLKYDISFPKGQTTRPPSQCLDDETVPDSKQEIIVGLRSRA